MSDSPPEAVYARGLTHRIAASLLLILTLAGILHQREGLGPGRAGWAAGGALFAFLLFWWWETTKRIEIHPEGLAFRRGGGCRTVRWEAVREVRYRAIPPEVIGHLLLRLIRRYRPGRGQVDERGVSIRCVIRSEDARPFVISSSCTGAAEAIETILARVNPRLLRESLDRLRSTGRADFGPVAVVGDSIVRGDRAVRFAEVGACGIQSGRFVVRKQGGWAAAIRVPVWRIPNVFALMDLLRQLDVPNLRRSDLASATLGG